MLKTDVELHMEEGRAEDHTMHRQATIQERAQQFQVTPVVIIQVEEPGQNITTTPGVITTMETRTARTAVPMIIEDKHSTTGQVRGIIVTQTARGETADRAATAADSTADPAVTLPLQCPVVVVEAVAEAVGINFNFNASLWQKKNSGRS